MSIPQVPNEFLQHLGNDATKVLPLIKCKKCGTIPDRCEPNIEINGCSRDFVSLNCSSTDCEIGTWFICCACYKSFARYNKAETHAKTTIHSKKSEQKRKDAETPSAMSTPRSQKNGFDDCFGGSNFHPVADSQETITISNSFSLEDDDDSMTLTMEDSENLSPFKTSVVAAFDGASPADEVHPAGKNNVTQDEKELSTVAKALDQKHDDWLAEALRDEPKASGEQLRKSLQCSLNMQLFWQAEHVAPGGGLIFLVARAFHRRTYLSPECLPDFSEAAWQMQNFMQYVGMSEKQRDWHAQITMKITSEGSGIITKTKIPNAKELRKFYKSDCTHCLWEALPVPTIQNIGGVAYVNPEHIVRFAFACGLKFDDIMVSKNTDTGNHTGKQYYVSQSQRLRAIMRSLQKAQDAKTGDYNVVVAWCTDWRDGFGVNRTKNNRKSVVAWTFSVSPGKSAVNDIHNTFCMALGQKKNNSWPQVEHQIRKDTSCFGNPKEPLEVYHGGLRKMVRVFVTRINASHDKPERADVTGTLSFSGNMHRSFGRLFHLVSPTIDSKKTRAFLQEAQPNKSNELANSLEWGWSDGMVDGADAGNTNANGRILPSCYLCRAKRLHVLLHKFPGASHDVTDKEITTNLGNCVTCADWTMDSTTASKLPFKAPAAYPTTCAPNCPVTPPAGRCTSNLSLNTIESTLTGENENYLNLTELEFPNMVKATKFAFFNLVSKPSWTGEKAHAYLIANGVAPKHAKELIDIARSAVKEGRAETVNYNDPEGIDKFRFPAAWIDPQLNVKDYIETIMHEVFLGVAESNFELCSLWNKAKTRDTQFRKNAQELLLELKKFGLNWLHTFPFSAGEDPKTGATYGTGGWQGENWIAWIRISKIVYLHALVPISKKNPKTTGNGDILRLVIVFTAFASRAMSHSGVNESSIKEFNNYLKEFLSCVKDLDIQTRHALMKKRTKKEVDPDEQTGADLEEAPGTDTTGALKSGKQGGNENFQTATNSISVRKGQKQGSSKKKQISATTSVHSTSRPPPKKRQKSKEPPSNPKTKTKRRQSDSDEEYVESVDSDSEDGHHAEESHNKRGKKRKMKIATTNKAKKSTTKKANESVSLSQPQKPKEKPKVKWVGGGEAWWTKSNYLSLPNLVTMAEVFGQLINFWDGGGKGEKFVQEVKPLITRGVHDYDTFFVVVMDKLYKNRVLDIIREMYSLFVPDSTTDQPRTRKPRFVVGPDGELQEATDEAMVVPDGVASTSPDDQDYSPMEDLHMSKLKTFYCYRSKQVLDRAIEERKPISGILVHNQHSTTLVFYALFMERGYYNWVEIVFDDKKGVAKGGLWYSPMATKEPTQKPPTNFKDIQNLAKMSTVAIPMCYGIGSSHPDSFKFCVITNWWKERQKDGRYAQPGLDASYYARRDNYDAVLERCGDEQGAAVI